MECACDVGVDDFSTMIDDRINKARKEHKCGECHEVINIGDKYNTQKEVHDGDFSTHKTCIPCMEVRDTYLTRGYFWGQIWEDLRECHGDISLADFESFSIEAQIKIIDKL
jgi:hypothetical protein